MGGGADAVTKGNVDERVRRLAVRLGVWVVLGGGGGIVPSIALI